MTKLLPEGALLAVLSLLISQSSYAQVTEITIRGAVQERSRGSHDLTERTLPQEISRDLGDLLRESGVAEGSRMGGHAIDPVIRGQRGNQLNATKDGAFAFGGCPNRMDPPTALLNVEPDSIVTVTSRYESVTAGPGGSGGGVTLRTPLVAFDPRKPMSARASSAWESNGNYFQELAQGSWASSAAQARAAGYVRDSESYADGAGNKVRSAFNHRGASVSPAFTTPTGFTRVTFEADEIRDALFAGAGMDSPSTDSYLSRFESSYTLPSAFVRELQFLAAVSQVNHTMDNYSLRKNLGPVARVRSDSDTNTARISAVLKSGRESTLVTGGDLLWNNRTAERYAGPSPTGEVRTLQSTLWPDLSIADYGLFIEERGYLARTRRIVLGLRGDVVDVHAGRTDQSSQTPEHLAPLDLYEKYHGSATTFETEVNPTGHVRFEQDLGWKTTSYLSAAYVSRTSDATERSLASAMGGQSWVGNPTIDPERHNQLEVGATRSQAGGEERFALFYDYVGDYILRDTARGQAGILQSDGASIYRNVNAELFGVEGSVREELTDSLHLSTSAAYTYGQNRDDSKPLAQIPPLFGTTELSQKRDRYRLAFRCRYALKQTRVDADPSTGSGLDVRRTPGHAVFDLITDIFFTDAVSVGVGVTNLFDRTYANHLNRSNAFNPEEFQVNEPGRSFLFMLKVAL